MSACVEGLILFGSETGNAEEIAKLLHAQLNDEVSLQSDVGFTLLSMNDVKNVCQ
jgi:flavodoxin